VRTVEVIGRLVWGEPVRHSVEGELGARNPVGHAPDSAAEVQLRVGEVVVDGVEAEHDVAEGALAIPAPQIDETCAKIRDSRSQAVAVV
jgi:hypothetical protein